MAEFRPNTWAELQDLLFTDTYNTRVGRYKSRFAYRGMSTHGYSLSSSLMRVGGEFVNVEPHLLRQFRKYGSSVISVPDDDWHWLAVAQHYGLPTRLLDWTYSPLVALHFATVNVDKYSDDGVVWMVNYQDLHKATLPSSVLAHLKRTNTWIFTADILKACYPTLGDFETNAAGDGDASALFFEPPSIDQRIFNQFGYFSVANVASLSLDTILDSYPTVATHQVVVPAKLKWEIRDKLDQSNISERVLFPGLDGIAAWLARYYAPRR
jgi:hypothetical protein